MAGEKEICERERLRVVLAQRGIKVALIDLDDTLIDTQPVFSARMRQFSQRVGVVVGVEGEVIFEQMSQIITGLKQIYSVNPYLMYRTAEVTARCQGISIDDPLLEGSIDELMKIYYEDMPPAFPGALEMVEKLNWCVRTRLVTHADEDWTWHKRRGVGLVGNMEAIECISSLGYKDGEAWSLTIEKAGVEVDEVMVAGDSWSSDVAGALEAGVKPENIYRVKSKFSWANKKPEGLPEICEIESFGVLEGVLIGK